MFNSEGGNTGIGEDVVGQLALCPEPQIDRQTGDQRLHRAADVLGRDPLPGSRQRVAGLLPLSRLIAGDRGAYRSIDLHHLWNVMLACI